MFSVFVAKALVSASSGYSGISSEKALDKNHVTENEMIS